MGSDILFISLVSFYLDVISLHTKVLNNILLGTFETSVGSSGGTRGMVGVCRGEEGSFHW